MNIDFAKMGGLVPAIIQDSYTSKVLMLGFMNEEALAKTKELGKVTFFSRTKNRLWTKGEESGNFLLVDSIKEDCDKDTLLIKVRPIGPCHVILVAIHVLMKKTRKILCLLSIFQDLVGFAGKKRCRKVRTRRLCLTKE